MACSLRLDGTSGTNASTPDHASLDITGDLDVRVALAMDDWTPGANVHLINKDNTSSERSWSVRVDSIGRWSLAWFDPTLRDVQSIVLPGATDGELLLLRFVLDVDDGAGGHEVSFQFKASTPQSAQADLDEDSGWTEWATNSAGAFTTSIASTAAPVTIGTNGAGAAPLTANVYAAIIKDGTTVADPDFTAQSSSATSFIDSTGKLWTLNGNAFIQCPSVPSVTPLGKKYSSKFSLSDKIA